MTDYAQMNKCCILPAIMSNSCVQYYAQQQCASLFTERHGRSLTRAFAQRKVLVYFCASSNSVAPIMEWLHTRDRDCGNIYSMLPLVEYMTVALSALRDRRFEHMLLRGKSATCTLGLRTLASTSQHL